MDIVLPLDPKPVLFADPMDDALDVRLGLEDLFLERWTRCALMDTSGDSNRWCWLEGGH